MHEIIDRSVLYQELAIQEITRGYKLVARLHSFIPNGEPQSELVGILLGEVLQALSMALSMLTSSNTCTQASREHNIISETSSASLSDQGSTEAPEELKTPTSSSSIVCGKGGRQQKLRATDPWTKVTYAPHDDGHQWRKYGQKNIQKSKLSRSYYRCTYKDEGCQATKHVQQKDCNDPPLFLVTYYEQHTCKTNNPMISITPQMTKDPLQPVEPNLFAFESNANMFCNQERTMLKVSTTDHQDSDQGRVDLQNMIIDQTTMGSVVVTSDQCVGAMPNSGIGDISSSACMSPSWEVMSMDYLKMGSFGFDAIEGFSSF